jgi:PAN domain-containing protein
MKGCIIFAGVVLYWLLGGPGAPLAQGCRFLLDNCPEQETRPPPPSSRNFTLYHGVDFDGYDIKPWLKPYDLDRCRGACSTNSSCQAFTFNVQYSTCILKSGHGPRKADPTAISGSVTPVSVPATRLRIRPGIDYPGGDLKEIPNGVRGVSLDQCSALCNDNGRCKGFSYVTSKSWCWPKEHLFAAQSDSDVVSGTK